MSPDSPKHSVPVANGGTHDFLEIARKLSETIGMEFFSMLTDQLAAIFGAKYVYVAEFVEGKPDRLRTLAACLQGRRMEESDFPLPGTPDAEVATGGSRLYMRGVREAFPGDGRLGDLAIEAFVGVPLRDAEGDACGIIAALYQEPLDLDASFLSSSLKLFAPRAQAELRRKRADDEVRQTEQRYRTFVELNPDACWRVEFDEPVDITLREEEQRARILRQGHVVEGNDALAQRLGLDRPEQLFGAAITDVIRDEDLLNKCLKALIRSSYRFSTLEITALDRNGKQGYYQHTHWGIVENGKLTRVWGSSRDITELRIIEAQFRHSQRLDSIGRLAAGVAHDFNNLLTIIHGYSTQLLETAKDTDSAHVALTEIRKAAEKGAVLAKQLLTFSRKQETDLGPLDLNSIVADDEQMLRRLIGNKIQLSTELEPSVGLVRANAGGMHQVLLNLAVNARDAMPAGGRLKIALATVDIREGRPLQLAEVPPGPYVRLSVSDSGTGMSPDVKAHLFEPFFTTKKETEGNGLGLSTVYGIVRQSGGHIVVDSEVNKGTTFEVFLPRQSP
jgi:signal transduction histidine kinase